MALETLKDLESIGGFKITRGKPNDITWEEYDKIRDEYPIHISDNINSISFKIQNKPVKEVGVNGCQVDTLIETAKIIIDGLDKKFSCYENSQASYHLSQALAYLLQRKQNRKTRNVEGLSME